MPLPKINTPVYELVLPSSGRKVKYRFNNNIFDTESLKRGVYILVLKGENISFKLVKS